MTFKGTILNAFMIFGLWGCSTNIDDTSDPRVSAIKTPLKFQINPNDPIIGDSIAPNISKGILATFRNQGFYRLEFDSETQKDFELDIVNVESGYLANKAQVYAVKEISAGRYQVNLEWNSENYFSAIRIAELGGASTKATFSNVNLKGVGNFEPSLNLIVHIFGHVDELTTPSEIELFKNTLKQKLDTLLLASSVEVGSIEILLGQDHPLYGDLIDENTEVEGGFGESNEILLSWMQYGQQSIQADMLSQGLTLDQESKLDVVIVNSFKSKNAVIGVSPFFGGGLGKGEATVIALARNSKTDGGWIAYNDNENLGETFVHEMGHFFGLRHTTAAKGEYSDLSLRDDGFSDTPYSPNCKPEIFLEGKATNSINPSNPYITSRFTVENTLNLKESMSIQCPDYQNLMFPFSLGIRQDDFSVQQKALVLTNLQLMPR